MVDPDNIDDVIDDVPARLSASAFLASALVAALSAAIIYNTLFLQHGLRSSDGGMLSAGADKLTVEIGPSGTQSITVRVDPLVEAVQRELVQSGFYAGPIDGLSGRRTRLAIAAYQKANGLQPTGEASQDLVDQIRLTREILAASGATDSAGLPQRSDPIRRVQIGLSELGYLPGQVDGFLGEQTRDAIRQFEYGRRLPSYGVLQKLSRALRVSAGVLVDEPVPPSARKKGK